MDFKKVLFAVVLLWTAVRARHTQNTSAMQTTDAGKTSAMQTTNAGKTSAMQTTNAGKTSAMQTTDGSTIAPTNATQPMAQNRCVDAEPLPISNDKCHRYFNYTSGICMYSIPRDALIYANKEEQFNRESILNTVTFRETEGDYMNQPHNDLHFRSRQILESYCFKMILDMYCHYYFPRCDTTSSTVMPQAICREACQLLNSQCEARWLNLMNRFPGVTWNAQLDIGSTKKHSILMDCSRLPTMGPRIPECYITKQLLVIKPGKKRKIDDTCTYGQDTMLNKQPRAEATQKRQQRMTVIDVPPSAPDNTTDCYYGNGYSYRGSVARTRSGYTCQAWSEQCPHRHSRTPSEYPELVGVRNACRNPGQQAPDGPWCYTTDRRVRWEYCDIPKCKQAVMMYYKANQKKGHATKKVNGASNHLHSKHLKTSSNNSSQRNGHLSHSKQPRASG